MFLIQAVGFGCSGRFYGWGLFVLYANSLAGIKQKIILKSWGLDPDTRPVFPLGALIFA